MDWLFALRIFAFVYIIVLVSFHIAMVVYAFGLWSEARRFRSSCEARLRLSREARRGY